MRVRPSTWAWLRTPEEHQRSVSLKSAANDSSSDIDGTFWSPFPSMLRLLLGWSCTVLCVQFQPLWVHLYNHEQYSSLANPQHWGGRKQKDCEFEANLSYIVRACHKQAINEWMSEWMVTIYFKFTIAFKYELSASLRFSYMDQDHHGTDKKTVWRIRKSGPESSGLNWCTHRDPYIWFRFPKALS